MMNYNKNNKDLSRIAGENSAPGFNNKLGNVGNNIELFSGTGVQGLARQKHSIDGLVRQASALVQNTSEATRIMIKPGVELIDLSEGEHLATRRSPEDTMNEELRKWGCIPYITR